MGAGGGEGAFDAVPAFKAVVNLDAIYQRFLVETGQVVYTQVCGSRTRASSSH